MTAIGNDHVAISMTRREGMILRRLLAKANNQMVQDEQKKRNQDEVSNMLREEARDLIMFIGAQLDHQEVSG